MTCGSSDTSNSLVKILSENANGSKVHAALAMWSPFRPVQENPFREDANPIYLFISNRVPVTSAARVYGRGGGGDLGLT